MSPFLEQNLDIDIQERRICDAEAEIKITYLELRTDKDFQQPYTSWEKVRQDYSVGQSIHSAVDPWFQNSVYRTVQ